MATITADLLLAFDLRKRVILEELPGEKIRFGPIHHLRLYSSPPTLDIDSDWIAERVESGTRKKIASRGRFTAFDLTKASIQLDNGEFTIRTSDNRTFKICRPYESMSYDS